MPNEMNHAEVAEELQEMSQWEISHTKVKALQQAAADECRIANGELVEVVHAYWILVKKECYNITDEDEYPQWKYCSNCKISQKHTTTFKRCPFCGALMDGKDDGHETN